MAAPAQRTTVGDYSLYIHVPFCAGKCGYCDFYSVSRQELRADLQAAVINETLAQERFFFEAFGLQNPADLRSIYIGGGTPSVLPRPLLRNLFAWLSSSTPVEWTVEANPESLDLAFLEECRRAGVTRISVGIQSVSDQALSFLGRPCTRLDIDSALELLEREWSGDLSIDLLAGIPGQSIEDVEEAVSMLDSARVSHVSLYSLTIEPATTLFAQVSEGRVRPNAEEHDEELWFAGSNALKKKGFRQYEISNFCLPGKECIHNLGYWNLLPYIGVGPSAVSTVAHEGMRQALAGMLDAPSTSSVLRLSNPRNLGGFLKGRDHLWGMEVEQIGPRDFLLETLMMGFRLSDGIPARMIAARFGWTFEELFPGLWNRWREHGMAMPMGSQLQLSIKGRLMLNRLLREAAERLRSADLPPLRIAWP